TCPRCGHAEVVYAAGQRGRVAALNPATGEWFWTFDLLLQSQAPNVELVSSPVVVADRAEGRDRRRIYLGAGVTSGFASVARLYCLLEECGAKTE
ncbi:MAG TPA: hypothetical protein VIL46_05405, partial [Gemmataceae bacterium]